jgi:hypothetical protein
MQLQMKGVFKKRPPLRTRIDQTLQGQRKMPGNRKPVGVESLECNCCERNEAITVIG